MIKIDVSDSKPSKIKCAMIYLFMLLPFARMDVYELPTKSMHVEVLYKRRKLIRGRMRYELLPLQKQKLLYTVSCFESRHQWRFSFSDRLWMIKAALKYHSMDDSRTVLTFGIK